jgi:hypothetical protein
MSGATEVYMTEHSMIRLKHLPCSSDLTPNDFYLFPTIKERLKDIQMVDEEDLFYRLKDFLMAVS